MASVQPILHPSQPVLSSYLTRSYLHRACSNLHISRIPSCCEVSICSMCLYLCSSPHLSATVRRRFNTELGLLSKRGEMYSIVLIRAPSDDRDGSRSRTGRRHRCYSTRINAGSLLPASKRRERPHIYMRNINSVGGETLEVFFSIIIIIIIIIIIVIHAAVWAVGYTSGERAIATDV